MDLKQINTISNHKFAKLMRSKIYWLFFVVGLGILLMSMIPLLVAEEFAQSGMAMIFISQFAQAYTVFGLFASIALGSIVLIQDIRDGTMFTFLARPISRSDFIMGKIIGAFKLIMVFWVFQIIYFSIFLYAVTDYGISTNIILTFIFDLMFYLMMISVTAFFSILTGPIWAALIVLVIHFLPVIAKGLMQFEWGIWTTIFKVIYFAGPEFNVLSNWDSLIGATLLYDASILQKLAYFFTLLLVVLLPTFKIFTARNLTPKD